MNFKAMGQEWIQDGGQTQIYRPLNDDGSVPDFTTGWVAELSVISLNQPDKAGPVKTFATGRFTFGVGIIVLALLPADIDSMHTGNYAYQLNISDDNFVSHNFVVYAGQLFVTPSAFRI